MTATFALVLVARFVAALPHGAYFGTAALGAQEAADELAGGRPRWQRLGLRLWLWFWLEHVALHASTLQDRCRAGARGA